MLNKTNKIMNTNIGNKLKKLRKQKGWSQEQVADYLSLSQSAYARMESGESSSWANNIDKICEIFEIEIEDFFKQDNIVINHNQQGGGGYIQIVNQLSEKLIEQFEKQLVEKDKRIEEKDIYIAELKQTIEKLNQKA